MRKFLDNRLEFYRNRVINGTFCNVHIYEVKWEDYSTMLLSISGMITFPTLYSRPFERTPDFHTDIRDVFRRTITQDFINYFNVRVFVNAYIDFQFIDKLVTHDQLTEVKWRI